MRFAFGMAARTAGLRAKSACLRTDENHLLKRPRPREKKARTMFALDVSKTSDNSTPIGRDFPNIRSQPPERQTRDGDDDEAEGKAR